MTAASTPPPTPSTPPAPPAEPADQTHADASLAQTPPPPLDAATDARLATAIHKYVDAVETQAEYPRLGEPMLYFECSTADDRMVGRPCRVVEDVGDGLYDVDVDYFRTDTAAGKPNTDRVPNVPFCEKLELQRDKGGRFWLWPRGKNFFARATPRLGPELAKPPAPATTHAGRPSVKPPAPAAPAPTTPADRATGRAPGGQFIPPPSRRPPRDTSGNATGLVRPKEGAKFDE